MWKSFKIWIARNFGCQHDWLYADRYGCDVWMRCMRCQKVVGSRYTIKGRYDE